MNKRKVLFLLPALCSMALVSGCAAPGPGSGNPLDQLDYGYINAVEQQAAIQDVEVIWVNPPNGKTKVTYPPINID